MPRWASAVLVAALISAVQVRPARADVPASAPTSEATPEAPAPPESAPAPPPAAAPALAPTLTPEVPAVAAPALEAPAPGPPTPRGTPFYRKDWFWGAVGVAVLTLGIVLLATSGSNGDSPPTTLGNMHAF